MINSSINEFTVFADKVEDEGMDTSLLRSLCIYNYLSIFLGDCDLIWRGEEYTKILLNPEYIGAIEVNAGYSGNGEIFGSYGDGDDWYD